MSEDTPPLRFPSHRAAEGAWLAPEAAGRRRGGRSSSSPRPGAMSGRCCQGQTPSRDIPGPGKRLALPDGAPLPPGDYSTTPGGTVFGTTPGGERLGPGCGPGLELRGPVWGGEEGCAVGPWVGFFGGDFSFAGVLVAQRGRAGVFGAALPHPGLGFVLFSFFAS